MLELKALSGKLGSNYCEYLANTPYNGLVNGKIRILTPEELLKIGRNSPREYVLIANFGEGSNVMVHYMGDDSNSMKHTLDQLRLSNPPLDLGGQVFHRFRERLDKTHSNPVYLRREIGPGQEHKLEPVLKKLIEVYQRSEAYAAENEDLSGCIFNCFS